jgi:nicotinate-nucleotide--dimethylbenzimidazole phosphoribosyltransferase
MLDPTTLAGELTGFDDIRGLAEDFAGPDESALAATADREGQLTKPAGALGRLEEITFWAAGWQAKHPPTADHPQVCVFAGNHGVTARGVSAFPSEVTVQMVANFSFGGAAINQLSAVHGARLDVIPLELDRPTADFTEGPAMTEAECTAALAAGMAAVAVDSDILCIGEMGIGNTTAAAALSAALFGGAGADWAGRGTGVDDEGLTRKAQVIDAALARHGEALSDPLEALRRVGGRELAAMAGAAMAARIRRVPVILDGYVASAAAAVLAKLVPGGLDHAIAGHVSQEPGHRRLLEALDKEPLLDLGMRLGEASGAAVALGLVKSALAAHVGMATFAEAGVSDKEDGEGQ